MPGLGREAFEGTLEIGKGANLLVQVAPTLDLRNTDTINLFSSAIRPLPAASRRVPFRRILDTRRNLRTLCNWVRLDSGGH